MPTVIIHSTYNLDDYYEYVVRSIDQRFHNYQPTFPIYPVSYQEAAEYNAMASQIGSGLIAGTYDDPSYRHSDGMDAMSIPLGEPLGTAELRLLNHGSWVFWLTIIGFIVVLILMGKYL